jgi:hypothetical protein
MYLDFREISCGRDVYENVTASFPATDFSVDGAILVVRSYSKLGK